MKKLILLAGLCLLLCAQSILAKEKTAADYFQFVDATDGVFEDRVEIRWSAVPFDTITYEIKRDGVLLSVASSQDSLYIDDTGIPGIVYTYCVVMTDSTDPTISVTLCDDGSRIIFPPEDVDASDGLFEDYVRITWNDRSYVEVGYIIRRDSVPLDTIEADMEFYQDMTGAVGSGYTYEVIALDGDGNQSQAGSDSGFRASIQPPRDVDASDGLYADSVVITWVDDEDTEVGYRISRNGVIIGATGVDEESYTDKDT